jgi:tetratricopeptide (TPR) repeat protein
MADRYTYVPLIGIFLAITFLCRDWAARFRLSTPSLAIAGGSVLLGCLLITEHQLNYWKDGKLLFSHALAVTKNNDVACINLGVVLEKQGLQAEALSRYREALRINFRSVQAHNNLGNLLSEMGKTDEALVQYREALKLNPGAPLAHDNLGTLFVKLNHFDEAMSQYEQAAQLDAGDFRPHYLMGKALLKQGRDAGAIAEFREALRLEPKDFQTLAFLARVLASDENPQVRDGNAALAMAAKANDLTGGTQPAMLDVLAMAYAEIGKFEEARQTAADAVKLAIAYGVTNDVAAIQQRLQLYQNRQPFRQSFTSAPANEPRKN